MAVPLEFLRNIPYFSGLETAELESIRELFFQKVAERGQILSLEGEFPQDLYFVASGAVKVFKTSREGKEQILSIVRPGECLNDIAIFDGGPNPASAQSMGFVVLYGVKKDKVESLLRSYPKIALNVIKTLAARVRHLVSLVEDLSFRHVIGRVARILLEHAGSEPEHKLRLTQQEMAAMAGTAREVVGRSLKALEEEGAIKLDRHRIVILDRRILQKKMEAAD